MSNGWGNRGGQRSRGRGGQTAPQPCPDCGGEMWDNSQTKQNPRAPDYSCKDRQNCNGAIWLDNKTLNAEQAHAQGTDTAIAKRPVVLDGLFYHSIFDKRVASNAGLLKAEKELLQKPAAPPPPPPPPPPSEDLPF